MSKKSTALGSKKASSKLSSVCVSSSWRGHSKRHKNNNGRLSAIFNIPEILPVPESGSRGSPGHCLPTQEGALAASCWPEAPMGSSWEQDSFIKAVVWQAKSSKTWHSLQLVEGQDDNGALALRGRGSTQWAQPLRNSKEMRQTLAQGGEGVE